MRYEGTFLPKDTIKADETCYFSEFACIQDYIPDFPKEVEIDFSISKDADELTETQGWFLNSGRAVLDTWKDREDANDFFFDLEIGPSVFGWWPSTWGDLLRQAVCQTVEEILDTEGMVECYDSPLLYHLKTARLREWYPQWSKKGYPLTKETPPWEK